MKGARRLLLAVALLQVSAPSAAGALDRLRTDGWYTWQVEAADEAPAWCCNSWSRAGTRRGCHLDTGVYGTCDDLRADDGVVRIYARIETGTVAKLRVLGAACPVESPDGMTDLGTIDVRESFDWLRGVVRGPAGGPALAAIAMHRGEPPLRFLLDLAKKGTDDDVRRDAIFWLGQLRISEASTDLQELMATADDAAIRRHAAFSFARLTSPARADALIRQGREDLDAEVRSQAWFWLAQTGSSEGEKAILQAVADDPDIEVRKDAVFALAQLPGERGVDALFALLGDRQRDRGIREQALFWLVQSESERAFAYVDHLLTEAAL